MAAATRNLTHPALTIPKRARRLTVTIPAPTVATMVTIPNNRPREGHHPDPPHAAGWHHPRPHRGHPPPPKKMPGGAGLTRMVRQKKVLGRPENFGRGYHAVWRVAVLDGVCAGSNRLNINAFGCCAE